MQGFINGYYTMCVWITRFVYLNLLWILFTLLGIGIFGFFPSTAAMFSVVRKWIMGEPDVPIFKTFWKSYRKDFIKSNILGLLMLFAGYFLYIELQILRSQESFIYFVASLMIIATFILYLITFVYLFPLFVHFDIKTIQYLKWSLIIGVFHPILTIVLGVGIYIIHYATFMFAPALLFLFGGSVTAYLIMRGAYLTFSKYEEHTS